MAAEPLSWRDQAACLGLDREMFFPISDEEVQVQAAKIVCASCPVQALCVGWALRHGVDFGIWGGLTGEERRKLSTLRRHRQGAVRS